MELQNKSFYKIRFIIWEKVNIYYLYYLYYVLDYLYIDVIICSSGDETLDAWGLGGSHECVKPYRFPASQMWSSTHT